MTYKKLIIVYGIVSTNIMIQKMCLILWENIMSDTDANKCLCGRIKGRKQKKSQ